MENALRYNQHIITFNGMGKKIQETMIFFIVLILAVSKLFLWNINN